MLEGRIFEHAVISTRELTFHPELLKACEMNSCGMYNKCWTCPPAVGPMEKLKEKITAFSHAFVFTTKYNLEDSFDYEGMTKAKDYHNGVTAGLHEQFGKTNPVFGAGACKLCMTANVAESCAYPEACRFPGKIFPSVEAAGINVTELSRVGGIRYKTAQIR